MLLFISDNSLRFNFKLSFQYISCYCLSKDGASGGIQSAISIHLMLLFIKEALSFNQSSSFISIHLMLLFIEPAGGNAETARCISIHLMLLFIGNRSYKKGLYFNFNTSHVTVYRVPTSHCHVLKCISIHLMLLFILDTFVEFIPSFISIHLMLLFI